MKSKLLVPELSEDVGDKTLEPAISTSHPSIGRALDAQELARAFFKSLLNLDKKAKVLILCFIVVVGFGLGVVLSYYRGMYLSMQYPFNTFLFLPSAKFSDYVTVVMEGESLNPYLGFKSAQYPFLVIVGYLFSWIPKSFYFYVALVSGLFFLLSIKYLRIGTWYENATPLFVIPFLSYPFLFSVDRGNFEILLFILLLTFIFFFTRKQYMISGVILSMAIAMKAYPAVMLILFIPEKKYREMIICIASTFVLTLLSLLFFSGGFVQNLTYLLNFSNISSNDIFLKFTSIDSRVTQRGVALLSLIKIFHYDVTKLPAFLVQNFSLAYSLLAGICMIVTTLVVIFIEKETWKRVALLILAMLLLPPISGDYKLLYIFIPLYLFLDKESMSKADIFYLLMFAALLIPKNFFYLSNVFSDASKYRDISISMVINGIVMISMALAVTITGLRNWMKELRLERNSQAEKQ